MRDPTQWAVSLLGDRMPKCAHLLGLLALGSTMACQSAGEHGDSVAAPVIGGKSTNVGSWSEVVALVAKDTVRCTGTLIHARWVLTAAHCIAAPDRPNGGIDKIVISSDRLADPAAERIDVARVHLHERFEHVDGYRDFKFKNDIALLELATPSVGRTAYLMLSSFSGNPLYGHSIERGTLVGWGDEEPDPFWPNEIRRERALTFSSPEFCNSKTQWWNVASHDPICTGDDSAWRDRQPGPCGEGDGGAPVFVHAHGGWYQAGLFSSSAGCGDSVSYYTSLIDHADWIRRTSEYDPFAGVDSQQGGLAPSGWTRRRR